MIALFSRLTTCGKRKMDIEKEFKEKFCYERMDFDGRNRHHYINPTVVEKPQFIIDWIKQQVSVEPEAKVNLADIKKEFYEKYVIRHRQNREKTFFSNYYNQPDKLWQWFEEKLKAITTL